MAMLRQLMLPALILSRAAAAAGDKPWFGVDPLAPLLARRLAATPPLPLPRAREDTFVFLDNGVVRLGIDTTRGGSVGFFGPAGDSGVNYVNIHDFGREVQVSYYTGPAPYDPPGCDQPPSYAGFPYNPIGAGDFFGNSARIVSIDVAADNRSAVVTSVPQQWACNNTPAEALLVKTITLVGAAAEVTARIVLDRPDRTAYAAFDQELPAVYVTGTPCALWAYTGDAPYTGDTATQLVPPDPQHGLTLRVPEQWLAFLLPDGSSGVGLWHPDATVFAAMRWNGSTTGCGGGPHDDATGYVSARFTEVLDADIDYTYNYSLVLGGLDAIRGYAAAKAAAGAASPGLPYSFARDRQHFAPGGGANSTWPVAGYAHVPMPGDDPNWVGGHAWLRAEAAPTVYVTAAFSQGQHDTAAQLFFQAGNATCFDAQHVVTFPIVDDGAWRTYAVDMAGAPGWAGVVSRLRFDPVSSGQPGAWVNISCISASAPPAPVDPHGRGVSGCGAA